MRLAEIEALSSDTLDTLRDALRAANYAPDVIAEGERIAPGLLDALRLPMVHAAWREAPTPARTLARLFLYLDAVSEAEVRALLSDRVTDALIEARALTEDAAGLRAAILIAPFFDLLLVSDPLHLHGDAVMGPGPTTIYLAEAMPGACPDSVLDVGCGAGTLCLLAASRGATRAVGVDISPRAVAMSQLNARLNRLDARFLVSDLCASVRGQRFDLVVSQPAFIAQPPDVSAAVFAHGGPRGDELATRLLSEIPGLLNEGGSARVLVQSAVPAEAPLHQRVRAALGDHSLSALVAVSASMGVEAYSVGYAAVADASLGDAWRETALRYRAHLRAMRIESFQLGLVSVRADGLGFTATLPVSGLRGVDAQAIDALTLALALAARPDRELLDASVRGAEGVAWVEERDRPDSAIEPRWIARVRRPPLADRELSEASWVLLGLLDGAARVRDAVVSYAEVCGAKPQEVAPQVLGFVRENLARGLLVPA